MSQDPSMHGSPPFPGSALIARPDGGAIWGTPQVFTFDVSGVYNASYPGNPGDACTAPVVAFAGGTLSTCISAFEVLPAFAGDATVTTPVIIDIWKSTDGGATYASIWATNPGNRPTIAPGAGQATVTTFDEASYNKGDMFIGVYVSGGYNAGAGDDSSAGVAIMLR